MNALLRMEAFPDREFNADERGYIAARTSRYATLKAAGQAGTNRALFTEFASLTRNLAERLGSMDDVISSTGPSSQRGVIFSRVSEELHAYLELADIVTVVNRPR